MSARPLVLAAALAALGGLGFSTLPANAGANVAAVSRGVTIPAFYTPPATLPAADDALVRSEPFPLAVSLPGLNGPMPGRATRLMYKSTDSTGRPVAVSGAYIEPSAAWSGPGPRPLVAVAPGTMGQGDQCSASLGLERGLVVGDGTISLGYENLSMYALLSRGIAVVVTDYPGLGTTTRLHTYLNRVDQGHAVLDAARAARALTGTSITERSAVGLFGYSQGGGAVASAAELQPSYAPDVPLRATYAGAPPADLAGLTAALDGTELSGALGWVVNGLVRADPTLQPLVDTYVNDAGRTALTDLATRCVGDAIFAYASTRSTTWTKNGESISDIIEAEPALHAYFAEQRIGTGKPAGTVRIAIGVSDNLVPHAQVRDLAVNWCRRGGNVVYAPISLPGLGSPLLNHFAPWSPTRPQPWTGSPIGSRASRPAPTAARCRSSPEPGTRASLNVLAYSGATRWGAAPHRPVTPSKVPVMAGLHSG